MKTQGVGARMYRSSSDWIEVPLRSVIWKVDAQSTCPSERMIASARDQFGSSGAQHAQTGQPPISYSAQEVPTGRSGSACAPGSGNVGGGGEAESPTLSWIGPEWIPSASE